MGATIITEYFVWLPDGRGKYSIIETKEELKVHRGLKEQGGGDELVTSTHWAIGGNVEHQISPKDGAARQEIITVQGEPHIRWVSEVQDEEEILSVPIASILSYGEQLDPLLRIPPNGSIHFAQEGHILPAFVEDITAAQAA